MGWNGATGLSGGTLAINQNPVAADFDIGNVTQTAGSVTPVTITPKAGKSGGAITIYYSGSPMLPLAAGTYAITFDVAAVTGWNSAAGLAGGTLTINVDVNFTITFTQITDSAPSIAGPTISRTGDNRTATLTVSGQYSSIAWYITGTTVSGSGASFTLNSGNTAYNSPGEHFLTVEVWKDGKPYNKTVVFTVEQ
jgi:hypothetical protein